MFSHAKDFKNSLKQVLLTKKKNLTSNLIWGWSGTGKLETKLTTRKNALTSGSVNT